MLFGYHFHVNNSTITYYSLEKILVLGVENVLPETSDESILFQKSRLCYKIESKADHFNSFDLEYRTFTVSFGDHISMYWLPPRVIVYATSYENSFGVEYGRFHNGRPHITEILLNHHATVSIRPKRINYSKEKNPDCEEQTWWEKLEEKYIPEVKEACPDPCSFSLLPSGSYLKSIIITVLRIFSMKFQRI